MLVYDDFKPDEEGLRETLTSTGNGYFCMRGAAEWEEADAVHYPGTYAHGVYNRESTVIAGRPVPNEDLVNLPRGLSLKVSIEGEEPFRLENVELLSYRHTYDVRYALLTRALRFRDRAGRETSLTSRRFVSMGRMHLAAIDWKLIPENWSGRVEIVSSVDGRVLNRGVARYQRLWGRHLDPEGPRLHAPDVISLKLRTRQSQIDVAVAARTRVYRNGEELMAARITHQMPDYIQQVLTLDVQRGEPVRVEKMVALYTSRDRAISEPLAAAGKSVERYPTFEEAFEGHAQVWEAAMGGLRYQTAARSGRAVSAAPPYLARNADLFLAHSSPRRRRTGPRPKRRGLPRTRLLGRAVRLSVPELPAPRNHPGPVDVSLPPDRRGAR